MSKIKLAIHGAAGRMGRRLVALACEDPQLQVAAALDSPQHAEMGRDAGELAGIGPIGVPLAASWSEPVQVVIDFSVPQACEAIARACQERRVPLVVATTGLTKPQKDLIAEVAHTIPVVWSPSMSTTVNLAMKLVATAAQVLKEHPAGADVEIIERHHRFKEDAPSGTALRFGEIIAGVMGQTAHTHGREGQTGRRPRHEIGYHALRVGDNPGEHTIVFGLMGETLEVTVRASNRDCYALGALAAAKFVANRGPGVYSMWEVLGLE